MKLIGGTRSPYVRRVAVSLTLMGFDYAHEATSPFETPDAIRRHNPLTRIPTLILDDGEVLVESYAILDALNEMAEPDTRLIPMSGAARRRVMKLTAVAIGATDKLIWSVYERRFRPAEKIHQPWIDHNVAQLLGGLAYLEDNAGDGWLAGGDRISLADVGAVVALQQTEMARPDLTPRETFPRIAALAVRCEAMAAFSRVAPAQTNRDQPMQAGTEFRDDARRVSRLPAETVKRLTAINPWKAWYGAFETAAILALAIGAAVVWWTPWVVIPAIIVITGRQQACFVLAHDAAHYRMFESRTLNDIVGRLFATPVGISMCTYRVIHRLHHNHLYEDRDPDTPLHGGYPRGRAYLAKKLAKDLLGLTAYKTYSYFFGAPSINDDAEKANRPLDDTSPALRKAARGDRWVVVGFHIAAPVIAFWTGYGIEYLVLWVLPLVTTLQALLRFRAICEHGAVTDLSSPLTAARTNLAPGWLRWWMFPHHVNYHVEHHLYPSIPHYNLPACHAAMAEHGMLEQAEVRDIFATAKLVVAPKAQLYPSGSAVA